METSDPESFVRALEKVVRDGAVSDATSMMTLPPGRKPAERIKEVATWYSRLSEPDQEMVRTALGLAADSALFGFLCVLDGARTLKTGDSNGFFRLLYVNGVGDDRALTGPGEPSLHEFFQKSV